MRTLVLSLLVFLISISPGLAQQMKDTVLQEITIQAYTSDRPLKQVAASIGIVTADDLVRFNSTSILSAMNTIPGVRMEERSPGSYRFSIRGSLLRSPFGIRNVKVYWNGLPFTDAGGNTYLNLLDNNSIGRAEIIKGPAGSLYGAGTGGVILLSSPFISDNHIEVGATIGSYGLLRNHVIAQLRQDKMQIRFQFAQQFSDGYRDQSAMKRQAANTELRFLLTSKSTLTASLFYTYLFYETPGGLTLEQYNETPKASRPAAGPNKGAAEQHAAVYNRSPWASLLYEHSWNNSWTSNIGVIASFADFKNPAIRNYEERQETNAGIRNENHYAFSTRTINGKFSFGLEAQSMGSPIQVSGNTGGSKDTLQTDDVLTASTGGVFSQLDLKLPEGFIVTVGAGVNFSKYGFERRYPENVQQTKTFTPVFSPRIAVMKTFKDVLSIYGNVSHGFSPPSLAEVRPSANIFNRDLQPEIGTNYELGFRVDIDKKLSFDISSYSLKLAETIVIRHLHDGADYFVNAGKTNQRGIEAATSWNLIQDKKSGLSQFRIWATYNYNHYRFKNYQSGDTDLTGKNLTGVPPVLITSGIDLKINQRFYFFINTNYTDHVPLNDANTAYAGEYFLLGAKSGYRLPIGKSNLEIFAGVDNALDKKYSLGNDLNAIGSRFYNAAPSRNYFAGLKFDIGY